MSGCKLSPPSLGLAAHTQPLRTGLPPPDLRELVPTEVLPTASRGGGGRAAAGAGASAGVGSSPVTFTIGYVSPSHSTPTMELPPPQTIESPVDFLPANVVNSIIHLHRAEISAMTAYRIRMDTSTKCARKRCWRGLAHTDSSLPAPPAFPLVGMRDSIVRVWPLPGICVSTRSFGAVRPPRASVPAGEEVPRVCAAACSW